MPLSNTPEDIDAIKRHYEELLNQKNQEITLLQQENKALLQTSIKHAKRVVELQQKLNDTLKE